MIKLEQLEFYQGATEYMSFNYLSNDGQPVDLTGSSALFAYRKTGEATEVQPTITGSVITVRLSPLDTSTMIGIYDYELKLKDIDGEVEVIGVGTFKVIESLMPTFTLVP